MDLASETPAIIEFGRFRVVPHRRELLADGRPIHLGGRTFDVLMALIAGQGAVVEKDALMQRVWPNQIVAESSLHVQISVLRNALGADRKLIRTISGRGYQFTGEIRAVAGSPDTQAVTGAAVPVPAPPHPPTNLPEPVSELIGRDAELEEILGLTAAHRLVTLTGAGGVGKTRLGLEVARRLLPKFADGVWAIELAPFSDPDLVPATVATALGLDLVDDVISPERVANALASKQILLLLDNCEHLVGAAASMAEALLHTNPEARVIATSREPLRAEGECLYRVPSLAVPTVGRQDAEDPLRYGAVRLFVARARAAEPQFLADERVAAVIAAICRHLDGIPLAIELAAARTNALGVEELAARLDDCFDLLTGGRRTALPRHQTLRATLDWSYQLLPEPERVVLRRLAIFVGPFTLRAASTVAATGELADADIVECAANLVAKSLLAADLGGAVGCYRLLETTRAYALEKLTQSGELEQLARRHAEYYRDLYERCEIELQTRPSEWLAAHGRRIDNLRAALDWAFSPTGDVAVGVALTIAAVPVWVRLSLVQECRVRVERALASLVPEAGRSARQEMKLYAALGASLLFSIGPMPEIESVWAKALEIAESLGDTQYQLRALYGLWACRVNFGEYRVALTLAQRFYSLAKDRGDPADLPIGDQMIGTSLHYWGDQTNARRHVERMLGGYVAPVHRLPLVLFQFDQQVVAHLALARILWLQGFPDQARRTAQNTVDDARALNHAVSLCLALNKAACPVSLFTGDLAAAESYVAMLLDSSAAHALPIWRAEAHRFHAAVLIRNGDFDIGLRLLRTSLEEAPEAGYQPYFTWFLGGLAEGLGRAGQIAEGLEVIDKALARSERNEDRWCVAELLRIRGELLLLQGAPGAAAAAEDHFRQALDWARRQGALSWELRAATSLARLLRDQGRSADAWALLQPVYDRFTEGFDTADLRAAKALIDGFYNTKGHNAAAVVELNTGTTRRLA
jgi:predicted ATPase/DNA-binding winged helix-turn-helix (wHTH) protein